mmetsp:Transcript_9080/g.1338  ORF Transcript_9080/g.1338 Transcript_9080/m.1338 type:complete len:112 (-) Transcript_9080:2199-2534(-)
MHKVSDGDSTIISLTSNNADITFTLNWPTAKTLAVTASTSVTTSTWQQIYAILDHDSTDKTATIYVDGESKISDTLAHSGDIEIDPITNYSFYFGYNGTISFIGSIWKINL